MNTRYPPSPSILMFLLALSNRVHRLAAAPFITTINRITFKTNVHKFAMIFNWTVKLKRITFVFAFLNENHLTTDHLHHMISIFNKNYSYNFHRLNVAGILYFISNCEMTHDLNEQRQPYKVIIMLVFIEIIARCSYCKSALLHVLN